MTKATIIAASALVLGVGAHAAAAVGVGDVLGVEDSAIEQALSAQGYAIDEIEREDDEIEVEATLDGVAYELTISPETGAVTEIELEDSDSDDDGDEHDDDDDDQDDD